MAVYGIHLYAITHNLGSLLRLPSTTSYPRAMYALGPVVNFAPVDLQRNQRRPYGSKAQQAERSNNNLESVVLADTTERHTAGELITYIFPDFKAVSYFQKEFIALNEFHVAEETEAQGFEIYLVDQWIRGRKIGGVVSTYTGNMEAKVKVIKFTVLRKPSKQYPGRFQEYLNEMMMNHATFKKMEQEATDGPNNQSTLDVVEDGAVNEFLLVTNLEALPSNLNLIPIPEGDTRLVEERFVLNSNLKKLNCGGRSLSLAAQKVSDASEDKFRQMYKLLDETVPIKFAIRQLVNLIQSCLFYFDFLDARYCDGLLCQKTEDAINNWWNLIGLPHFNVKPNPKSGILPSKTVAAILSLTLSVRLRLHLYGGCDVPKDVFDFENFMLSIGHFQKQAKIEKKRKLDLLTLLRLFSFTNQKFPSDSTKHTGDLSGDEHEDFYDPYVGSYGHGKNLRQTQPLNNNSLYKRNKLYYSKELKKLTNVVKNTVQDHIIVREDDDNFFDPPSASGGKIRNKIASKLVDNVVPADIETLDLEFLVRKHLTGKTLKTLWYGTSHHSDQTQRTLHVGHNGHRRNSRVSSDSNENSRYKFISLKEAITMNQASGLVTNDRGKRAGRMRFGFQGRRPNVLAKMDMLSDFSNPDQVSSKQLKLNESLLDAQLNQLSCGDNDACQHAVEECFAPQLREKDTRSLLNRRNSFPIAHPGADLNLNTIEFVREERAELLNEMLEKRERPLQRSRSSSCLDEYLLPYDKPVSEEQVCMKFLQRLMHLAKMESLRANLDRSGNDKIRRTYKQMNFELVKLHNIYSQMQSKHENIEDNYSAVLSGRMRDITDNIDRMAFRSRDLLKKINELDENTRKFDFNMKKGSVQKLEDISEHLIRSPKFQLVFKDDEERQKIIFSLTGRDYIKKEDKEYENTYWGLRILVTYLYDLMVFVLQLFNFDRSKMDLDRIRKMYRKIDPNRRFIDKAYRLVGQEPSAPSTEQ